jgi:squalene-hopene/tetraprenyl-beta-curcumene cyclase
VTLTSSYPLPTVMAVLSRSPRAIPTPDPARFVAGPDLASGVDRAIARTQAFLLANQHPDGYWWGELESNPTMEAEYVFLTHFLGIVDPARRTRIRNFILSRQQPDGGWNQYYGGPSDVSTSCECYLALKMTGVRADDPPLRSARQFILAKGGVERARVFTKIWFALLGQWDWRGAPYLPPELALIPNGLPFNIYEFAMWSRATIVPMSVLLSKRPTRPVPPEAGIDELFPLGRDRANIELPVPAGLGIERLLYAADRVLRHSERLPWLPTRRRAFDAIEKWIVDRQEADGSWGGIQPPWVYCLMALSVLGYSNSHPVIRKGIEGFERYGIEEDTTWRLQPSMSPLWDTALVINAMIDSDLPAEHPSLRKAADWLIARQIRRPGDWRFKARGVEPGGWAFEFTNDTYPDTDDAAEVLLALGRAGASDEGARAAAVERGIRWLIGMQSANGGWGAYDKDNTSRVVTKLPFCDFGETIDPPSVDVTAHIIEMLGLLRQPLDRPYVRRALDYIWREQEVDHCWFGRWGVNYVYGTGAVLPALAVAGHDMADPRVQRAVEWLVAHQNGDGGWGESCASYANPGLRGRGPSMPSQTAWALLGLIAAGRTRSEAADRGVNYLLQTQLPEGDWEEPEFTGTGFPGYGIGGRKFLTADGSSEGLIPDELPAGFMIKYHMYRIYWPLMALGRYRRAAGGKT